MKSLAYILYDFHTGGMETSIYNVASRLRDQFNLHFIATHVKSVHKKFRKIGNFAFVDNYNGLVNYLRNNKMDIVQVNIEDWYAQAAKEAGVKRVVERTDGDRNCCKSSKRYVDVVIASTKGTVPLILKQMGKNKVFLVYNGIDLNKFNNKGKKERFGFCADDIIIGRVGRLVAGKNISMLIRSVIEVRKKHKNVKLVIVGDNSKMPGAPPMRARLEKEAAPLGKNVVFTGDVEEPTSIINGFDVGVCVSNPGNEGIPNSLIEPMGAGSPGIGTNVGDIKELVKNNVNGFLIPHSNDVALYNAIMALVENKELRIRLGNGARSYIEKHFNIDNMVKEYKRLYLND